MWRCFEGFTGWDMGTERQLHYKVWGDPHAQHLKLPPHNASRACHSVGSGHHALLEHTAPGGVSCCGALSRIDTFKGTISDIFFWGKKQAWQGRYTDHKPGQSQRCWGENVLGPQEEVRSLKGARRMKKSTKWAKVTPQMSRMKRPWAL